MTIKVYEENGMTVIAPEGKIDHLTAPEFENKAIELVQSHNTLTLDMAGVKYVSSAALRVILKIYQNLAEKDGLILKNVNQNVMDIFQITKISDFLDIR